MPGLASAAVPFCRKFEKILNYAQPVFGRNAFGMKLHAMRREALVGKSHDETIGHRCNGQALRHRIAPHNERMVANAPERAVKATKNHFTTMFNSRELAMHRFWRAHDFAAKTLPERLVSEANPKDRDVRRRGVD